MSKIPPSQMSEAIQAVLKPKKQRKFLESVDLQVNLKNYDTQKDKRFSGSLRLPNQCRPNMKVCVIGDAYHVDAAAKENVPSKSMDDLKKLNKNKKLVKKMCAEYDAFLASETIIKTIPRVVGPHMNRAGKFPTALSQSESMNEKIVELRSTVKFQLKKVLCLGTCVGHVKMNEDELRQNTVLAINFLVSLLKKNWQNMKSIYIKSSMGDSNRVY